MNLQNILGGIGILIALFLVLDKKNASTIIKALGGESNSLIMTLQGR